MAIADQTRNLALGLDAKTHAETHAETPLALFDSVAEKDGQEATQTLDFARLFHLDIRNSPLLKKGEERTLAGNARKAWQDILCHLKRQRRLVAFLLGEEGKAINYESLHEQDILHFLDNLQARLEKPGRVRGFPHS